MNDTERELLAQIIDDNADWNNPTFHRITADAIIAAGFHLSTAAVAQPLPLEEVAALISEGVHTGLRKGSDAEDAGDLWRAIYDSETSAWWDAVRYAAWGLDYMGYAVVKKENSK